MLSIPYNRCSEHSTLRFEPQAYIPKKLKKEQYTLRA